MSQIHGLLSRQCWCISELKDAKLRPLSGLYLSSTPALGDDHQFLSKLSELSWNYWHVQVDWSWRKQPPSGVRVISWSRNCPNCITMCVKPFERSSSVPPSCLCILLDTVRALTFTWKLKTYLVTSLVKIFLNNSRFTFLEKPCAVSEDHAFQALH